jgi:hypothetical protein
MYVKCSRVEGAYLKAGRFEYYKGDHRILGNVGWSNVGRTWDGALLGYGRGWFNAEIFGFEMNERDVKYSDDVILLGAYFEIADPAMDFFILWDRDNVRNLYDNPKLSRFTAGLYRHGKFLQFDYTTNLAYQFGDAKHETLDIAAYLATLEIGYTFDMENHLRLAAGADITSGDDDTSDDKLKTYDNLYYTGHKFRGHMDLFVIADRFDLSGYGLNDFFLKVGVEPTDKVGLNGHFHYFKTDSEYASRADNSKTASLGTEIDLFVTCGCLDRFTVQAGGSAFYPSEAWRGEDSDPAYWVYIQTTAEF